MYCSELYVLFIGNYLLYIFYYFKFVYMYFAIFKFFLYVSVDIIHVFKYRDFSVIIVFMEGIEI